MIDVYEDFLAQKEPIDAPSGIEPRELHPSLFGFQAQIVRWACKRGRAAIFADTGLGKTRMQLEWARQIDDAGTLIVAPLAVAEQTIAEAARMDLRVEFAADQSECNPGIYITNYEKLHRFDPKAWTAVVLDESSILKSITGKTRERLVQDWTTPPYRLACTATPAPNDVAELANHSEFLGVMTRRDMLASFFLHDDDGWRLKGHARAAFFRWMSSWATYIRKPSDLGFSDDGYNLPPMQILEHRVPLEHSETTDELFPSLARGIQGRTKARRQSLTARVEQAVELIRKDDRQWLVWCGLNDEQRALADALGDECVSIEGNDTPEDKIARERAWREGKARVLITKPSIFGFGMNWQHCNRMLFLGLGDSWESYYQSIRRCWRFGQTQSVEVHIVLSDAESKVSENVWRKEREALDTASEVIAQMGSQADEQIAAGYVTDQAEGEGWKMLLGDCAERTAELQTGSVALSIHSPPFAQLYTYSASPRDMGNCRNYEDFFEHYRFAVRHLLRATMPGRRACVHVQQIAMTQVMQGVIAWRDFRAEVVKLYIEEGWIYHGEIVIDKDPQAQAIRTKSKSLLFVQKNKDSSWSIPAMADYILLFRAPGENAVPVETDVSNEEWIRFARPIWYGIRESATLQAIKGDRDEKHVAPLQLETVERCLRLWSNKGELVCDPFAGIGTTGYVALQHDRRFIGVELKPEYWHQAVKNLEGARSQLELEVNA